NWRGITLLNTVNKILGTVILERLNPTLQRTLRNEQAGFRPGRSCTEQINTLRIIIEQFLELRSPLYLVFVDFERAFDTLLHSKLWEIMKQKGIPSKIINIIQELYRDASCQVFHKGQRSNKIVIKRGVKQGCILS